MHNASGIGMQQRQPQLRRMNQQDLMANQQHMDMQSYQMHGAHQANVAVTQIAPWRTEQPAECGADCYVTGAIEGVWASGGDQGVSRWTLA